MRRGQVQLITGHHDGYLLVVSPLLPDLLEAQLHALQRRSGRDGVHQEEGVGGGNAQPPHRGELHVPSRIQYVDLQRHVPQVVFSVVQVFHRAPVLAAVGVH